MLKKKRYFEKVFEVTRQIPFGRVSTYGAIADYLALGSARMVGWALNHCGYAEIPVPAHRVVDRKGELTGRNQFPHPGLMQQLLENEGVHIENHQVKEFKELFWHPGDFRIGIL